jgi:hypothetical protein
MMTDTALAYLHSSDGWEIGVDQTAFLLCKEQSAREWSPVFMGTITGTELYAVKWRNWKVHFFWQERQDDTPQKLPVPKLVDLYVTPPRPTGGGSWLRSPHRRLHRYGGSG